MPFSAPCSLLGATPITTAGAGTPFNLGTLRANGLPAASLVDQRIKANAAFASSIAFVFETSRDQVTWEAVAPIPVPSPRSSALVSDVKLPDLEQFVRVRWTTTPSTLGAPIVVQMDGVSKILYASIADADPLGLPANAYGSLTGYQQWSLMEAASGEADAAIRMGYLLPLKDWGYELTEKVVAIFTFLALRRRGINPEPGAYDPLVDSAKEARKWLQALAAANVDAGLVDSSATGAEGGALITTTARRGWNNNTF